MKVKWEDQKGLAKFRECRRYKIWFKTSKRYMCLNDISNSFQDADDDDFMTTMQDVWVFLNTYRILRLDVGLDLEPVEVHVVDSKRMAGQVEVEWC